MSGMTKELARLVNKCGIFLQNGRSNPEIKAALEKYRFGETQMAAGDGLVAEAKEKAGAFGTAKAMQLGATDDFTRLFDETWDQAQTLAELLAILFDGDTEKLVLLGLHKKRDEKTGDSELAWPRVQDYSMFLPWARNLYAQAQGMKAPMVLEYFPAELGQLAEEAAEVEQLADLDHVQENAKAKKQHAREIRDEAAATLKAWWARAQKFARLALKGKPQLLEALGMRAFR